MNKRKRLICVTYIEPRKDDMEELGELYGGDAIYATIRQGTHSIGVLALSDEPFKYNYHGEIKEDTRAQPSILVVSVEDIINDMGRLNDTRIVQDLAYKQGAGFVKIATEMGEHVASSIEDALKVY